jgi:hypothetical protein
MAVRYSTAVLNSLLGKNGSDAGADGIRGIFENGVIEFYTGAQPVSADAAATGTSLGLVTVGGGHFTPGTATNGLNFDSPVAGILSKAAAEDWKFKGSVAGTIGWFRFHGNGGDGDLASTTSPRIDGSVGITSGDIQSSSVTSVVNGVITIDTFSIAMV